MKRALVGAGMSLALLLPGSGMAQQVTYNNFNAPAAAPSQTSTACTSQSAASGVFFCFNPVGTSAPPSYVLENYPAALDPTGGQGGQYYALQVTQGAGSQGASVWYSIPQNVAGGFSVWYAFKITQTPGAPNTADGMAFVIQNALGSTASNQDPYFLSANTGSIEVGSGLTVLGTSGGGVGYGGIDNSIALEMDTFPNSFDPWDVGTNVYIDNHIALQSCGLDSGGIPFQNSPAHYIDQSANPLVPTSCLVTLNGSGAIASNPLSSASASQVTMNDGNPHQVVMIYNGPNDSPANYLYVYLDPAFVPGTHTPVAGSAPLFSGPFDITRFIKLAAPGNSAYLGFTASTGFGYEQHEVMGFAFTPHSSSTLVSASGGGTGTGSVVSTPAGIDCAISAGSASGSCSINYPIGSQISFQASATNNSTFTGWGGDCAGQGTSQTCVLTVNAATNVSANFAAPGPPPAEPIAVTLLGSGGGTVTDNATGISCSLVSGGTPKGTCASNYPVGSQLTLTATAAAGSVFTGWGTPCAGTGPTCTFTVDNAYDIAATFQQQSFGNVNVCPKGQNSPAPCSQSMQVTFTLPQTTNLGAIQVVTQGAPGLDFTLGDGGTCVGTINGGNACTATVVFTPLAPGLRAGAVTLLNSAGNAVATQLIYGVGAAPLAVFAPAAAVPVNTGTFALARPNGLLVDAAGNLFIADSGVQGVGSPQVLKITPDGTVSQLGGGFSLPQGMAEDGAGNLFIADNDQNNVIEIPVGCTNAACQKVLPNPLELRSQLGVAVDGSGNLFIGDFLDGKVALVPANGAAPTIIYAPGGGSSPVDLTTDAAGNLYIADFGLKTVAKVPVGCTVQSCVKSIGSGWSQPDDVAVDAAGNVFVAEEGLKQIVEVPAGCSTSSCQIVLASGVDTVAVKVDSSGNLLYDNLATRQILVSPRSQPPALAFPLTDAGSISGAQTVALQNAGNQSMSGSLALSGLGANFAASGTCASFLLTPGALCSESFTFTPKSTGYFTGSASFSDNTLNLSSAVVNQQVTVNGTAGLNGQATTTAVPNVVGLTQAAAATALTNAGLSTGTVSTAFNSLVPAGSVIESNPAAGTQVNLGSAVRLLVSTGPGPANAPNPLTLLNNYFVTGDYATAGVNLHGAAAVNGKVSGTINIPTGSVPTGADLIDGFLYWTTLENSASPSAANATFLGYAISGQQIGSDLHYTDGAVSGTLRAYRANVNTYFQNGANGIRVGNGNFAVSIPGSGTNGVLLSEGASLVVIYRVLSANFPLKSVVIYDGSGIPGSSTTQTVQGFYDVAGFGNATANVTTLSVNSSGWNSSASTPVLLQPNKYDAPLSAGSAYSAVIFSTAVNNPDKDGILGAWKAGPAGGDFHAGEPGYYDVKTGSWIALPGAKAGQKDLFVQLDYMCGAVRSDGTCDPNKENLFPSPDSLGNDPLAMVRQAFANTGIALHLQIGNAVPEDTCVDSPGQPCQFPNQPGVIGWKNSLEFSKVWPRNLSSCAAGGDCSPRFAYGQKDSYHYVLFGHSLAIPAWNSRYGSLVAINAVAGGQTRITTTDRGTGINKCPSRITIAGIQGSPNLNGVFNTSSCPDSSTMIISTPSGVTTNWSYPNNTLPEPVIGITSGTVTSISGYSDLGGADSAVTLGLWETAPNQDMSKRANVVAGTLFHELGHTIGLGHGGLYYDTTGSYVPTFEANCKPNYQSSMNYLFQLDGVGPNSAIAFSNQTLTTLSRSSLGSVTALVDISVPGSLGPATFPTSTWYVATPPSPTASAATLHCDGAPLAGDVGYRITGPVAPITPHWSNGQNITFDGQSYSTLRGFNDLTNIDLRQVGATGGQFASLASVLSFVSSSSSLNIAKGGSVSVGPGGTVTLGAGGSITVAGGSLTVPTGGTVQTTSPITFGTGGTVTLGAGGIVTPGANGVVGVNSLGGNVTLGAGGTITLGAGGNITLGAGGTVTLGAGGTITLGAGGASITIPAGGSYTVPAGGTITLGGGGNVTLGAGGTVTLGGGGNITLGGGGNITLGGGGTITLGAGGSVLPGSSGTVTLGGGGNITLGGGGTVTLGAGGNVTLGAGGNVTLGAGGTVTLGAGGDISVGSGGNVTLGAGGTVTLGAGGNITLGAGGTVTLGGGGNVTLGAGGTITLGGGGNITMNAGGTITLGAGGGTINGVLEPAGSYNVAAGGTITLGAGGNITLGAGGNVTLGAGGNITLGAGGNITLGAGGTVTLGAGGNVTLGAGGNVTLGAGGNITLGAGGNVTLGAGGNVTLGGGGVTNSELDFDSANSIVRPPPSATYTVVPSAVRVDWTAPAFGVVQTYTISRSVNGGPAVAIGSVSGVNGNPPATTFFDTNPVSGTVVYTIATTLAPDPGTGGQRQSPPSPPAVLTVDQTIELGALPSSVQIGSPIQVTATAKSNGVPNKQLVSFSTTGPCSAGPSTVNGSGVSSATVTLNSTGTCTVTASQAGDSTAIPVVQPAYNAATPVSGTFTIVSASSNTTAQTINFPQLPNVQYGSAPIPASATASPSGFAVTFTTAGPCSLVTGNNIKITGAGICKVTASAPSGPGPNGTTYSAASVTQSFNVSPAPLTVRANNLTVPYGQAIPSLTYTITGYVNGETSAVLNNTAPALTTTATSSSAPGSYPITVSTGTLAATNYSFLYVPGTLTIQSSPVITVTPASVNFGTVYLNSVSIQTITVKNTGTAAASISNPIVALLKAGNKTEYVAVNLCPPSLAAGKSCTITIGFYAGPYYSTPQTATLNIMDNAPGSPHSVSLTATVINPLASFSPASISFGTIMHGKTSSVNLTLSNPGATPLIFSAAGISIKGTNATSFTQSNNCGSSISPAGKCTITVTFKPATTGNFSANLTAVDNAQAGGGTQTVPLTGKAN